MESLWPQIEPLLAQVTKPARYIGGELGAQVNEHRPGAVSWLLLYPDTYEIGLPNQGLQILYEILNERDDAVAERAYAPWVDMEAAMRAAGVPLFSVEQHIAARDFDVMAFNLSAELVYTNVLNLLDLADVPLHAAYVPALYASTYGDGRLVATAPNRPGVPTEVAKRTVSDLADWPYPARPLVPLTEVVHDRLNVEVFRGCTRGCRFCQAGMITRPVRERPAEQVKEMVSQGLAWSGHDEVTLTSLSTEI